MAAAAATLLNFIATNKVNRTRNKKNEERCQTTTKIVPALEDQDVFPKVRLNGLAGKGKKEATNGWGQME